MCVVELVRKTIHMMRQKGRAVSQMTLDDDYNIPEAMPDAGMIVQEKGKLEIGDIRTENGRVLVRGSLQFFILYMEDAEESGLYSVKGQIPFEENMNVEAVQEGDSLKLDWMLEDVSAVLIRIRQYHHFMIIEIVQVEIVAYACAERGNYRSYLFVLQNLVYALLLRIQRFAAQRKYRLEAAVARLFTSAARTVSLDNVQLVTLRLLARA